MLLWIVLVIIEFLFPHFRFLAPARVPPSLRPQGCSRSSLGDRECLRFRFFYPFPGDETGKTPPLQNLRLLVRETAQFRECRIKINQLRDGAACRPVALSIIRMGNDQRNSDRPFPQTGL